MPSADQIMSRLNPVVRAVLRSRLHWLLSGGLALITVTGRKSSRRYEIPVGYQRHGDRVSIMVSEARKKSWWRNYSETGPMQLVLKGEVFQAEARLMDPRSAEFRDCCEATFRRVPFLPRVFGVDFDPDSGLGDSQLEFLAREAAIVRVDLAR